MVAVSSETTTTTASVSSVMPTAARWRVLVGPSRKRFLGALTGDPVEQRDAASWAACAVAAFAGADAVRVHSVAGALRAVQVGRALREGRAAVPEGQA